MDIWEELRVCSKKGWTDKWYDGLQQEHKAQFHSLTMSLWRLDPNGYFVFGMIVDDIQSAKIRREDPIPIGRPSGF